MNIYLISQDVNNGYDTYDSAVVVAESEDDARTIHPENKDKWKGNKDRYGTWCNVENVHVEIIGTANNRQRKGVILASFNAG